MATNQPTNNQLFTPSEMMAEAEKFALSKAKKTSGMTLGLSVMAGAFIGLAFIFYITVTTGSAVAGWGLSRLAGGLAFSMGLIFIVLCGGELFTSSVLSSISWANKQISFSKMLSIWAKVYVGNFLGAMLLLLLVTAAGLYQLNDGQWGLNALNIAQHKLHHTTVQAFSLGILCNLLVCLAIWLTFCSENAMTKAMLIVLPVAMFVSTGFEHCVANMFMVPLGIVLQSFAPESFWVQIGASPSNYADLNVTNFLTANLIPVTLGNIVGGAVLVGLANWSIYRRPQLKAANLSTIRRTANVMSIKNNEHRNNLLVKQIMNTKPIVLETEMPTSVAIDLITDNKLSGAPVCDIKGRLVGYFSVHDVMVDLWCENYSPKTTQKVVDLMTRDVIAIQSNERVIDVTEFLCIDKEQLYPVNNAGIATTLNPLPLEVRAKTMKVTKPQCIPVLDGEEFVGVISRNDIMLALRPIYGERLTMMPTHRQETA
ncbi:formate transporter FocA [Vibrio sp. ZSDE26]|uniref:Formate transporter FocA n=1 Tax=Vibrio amylolyticus TaxID=2847292 RepID=A0A9X2BHI1_9VIBR|nr:formate transporter FocA [Vibrio amylolyticus]MCK6263914.1 formate transporter FocA [Vibrio amylolyticus]